jgi:DNA-binding GntR family transcriptional regulator
VPEDGHRDARVNVKRCQERAAGAACVVERDAADGVASAPDVEGPELAEPDDTTREDILKEAGYEQVYDIDEIITRMPTPEEVERLEIPPGTPVAEHIRTGYTRTDQAVRVMISIIPGDTLILEYKIPT